MENVSIEQQANCWAAAWASTEFGVGALKQILPTRTFTSLIV